MRSNRPVALALVLAVLVVAPLTHTAVATGPSSVGEAPPSETVAGSPSLGTAGATAVSQAPPLSTTAPETESNTTNYLDVAGRNIADEGSVRSSQDISGAIERDVAELSGEYGSLSFERVYENATNQERRIALVRGEVARLENRSEALVARQQAAITAYNDGHTSTRQLVRNLSTVDASARETANRLDRVLSTTDFMPSDLRSRVRQVRVTLEPLSSTVRGLVGEAMAGERDPLPVYAVTSADGVVSATTDGEEYYRDAFLAGNWAESGPNQFATEDNPSGINLANDRGSELYPWAYDNINAGPTIEPLGDAAYRLRIAHPHGSFDAYLDGRTRQVFHETQHKRLATTPTMTTENATETVHVAVERTHGTGPMRVSVTDPASSEPTNASVTVNGDAVGSTGTDGHLWLITPKQSVRVRVTTEDGDSARVDFLAD